METGQHLEFFNSSCMLMSETFDQIMLGVSRVSRVQEQDRQTQTLYLRYVNARLAQSFNLLSERKEEIDREEEEEEEEESELMV